MKIRETCFNKVYLPFLKAQQRYQIFFGGASSGKSFFLAQRAVFDVVTSSRNYLICRNTAGTIKRSVFNEITKAIINFQLSPFFSINRSDMVITCTLNNNQILFCGLDDPEKIKSITPIKGVLTDIWIEEATEADFTAVKQLNKRLRGWSSEKKRVTLSFNPVLKSHWIFYEYFSDWVEDKTLLKQEELIILKTTYKDNRFLTKDDIYALENEQDDYFYQVYSQGNWGILGSVIYTRWKVQDLTEIKESFDNIKCGNDFGFSNDPNAFIVTHYDKMRKRIYVFDEVYLKKTDNEEIASQILNKVGNKQLVVCDCAEPKSIAELRKYGVLAIGAKKGPDSIDFGIKFLQKHEIIIDVSCQNFKNEISQYQWKEDKHGTTLPVPIDKMNDLLDALRYAYEDEMQMSKAIFFP